MRWQYDQINLRLRYFEDGRCGPFVRHHSNVRGGASGPRRYGNTLQEGCRVGTASLEARIFHNFTNGGVR